MEMNKCYTYFKYILEHKRNVFIECMEMSKEYKGKDKRELIVHAFTHDLSKFSFAEFVPYAEFFHGYYGIEAEKTYTYEQINNGESCVSNSYLKCKKEFLKAW